MSKTLNALLNTLFGMKLRDNKSGFVLSSRAVLHEVLQHRGRYRYFQCFISVVAHALGKRIAEIETEFHPRSAGQSFLNRLPVRTIAVILWEMARARLEFTRLRRRHASARA